MSVAKENLEARLEWLERELDATKSQLEQMSLTDTLTEILNRRGLQEEISGALRDGSDEVLVLLIDVDDFRDVNERLGHSVGDVLLRELARTLRGALPDAARLGRVGGDEFVALVPGANKSDGARLAEAVRLAVAETELDLPTGPMRITASISVASAHSELRAIDEILSGARLLLADVKRTGKNRVGVERVSGDGSPIQRLLSALRSGSGLRALRQPIVRLDEQQLPVAYELLSRSTVEMLEMPNDFFRVSLEGNILTLVDHRCFDACLAASLMLPRDLRCHLNLFPSTLLAVPVEDLLSALPRSPSTYCIEISEAQMLGDPAELVDSVRELKQAGTRVAIDDVGFGRTWLESLILLEPDVVKIDRQCVSGVATNPVRYKSLARLLGVLTSLGAEVVAEGIETRDDLVAVQELGVELGQGFFFGRPEAVDSLPPPRSVSGARSSDGR